MSAWRAQSSRRGSFKTAAVTRCIFFLYSLVTWCSLLVHDHLLGWQQSTTFLHFKIRTIVSLCSHGLWMFVFLPTQRVYLNRFSKPTPRNLDSETPLWAERAAQRGGEDPLGLLSNIAMGAPKTEKNNRCLGGKAWNSILVGEIEPIMDSFLQVWRKWSLPVD